MAAIRRVGRLKHKITLQRQTAELDALGRQVRTPTQWTAFATPWAEVLELSGRELEVARQKVADASHLVTIRYRSGVTSEQRVVFNGRTLEIKAVLDGDSSKREMQLVCGEVR